MGTKPWRASQGEPEDVAPAAAPPLPHRRARGGAAPRYDGPVHVRVISGLLLLAGCDEVLGLKEIPDALVADAPPACPVDPLPTGGDADGDGTLNEVDGCPFVANQSSNDEDGDTLLDACDPCPTIAGDLAGNDPDCDGIGAACDPSSEVPHVRLFYGFDSLTGIRFGEPAEDGEVVNGRVRMTMNNVNTYSRMRLLDPTSQVATYELAGAIENNNYPNYWTMSLVVEASAALEFQLEKSMGDNTLSVALQRDDADLAIQPIGQAKAIVDFHLRATIEADGRMTAAFTVSGVTTPLAATTSPITGPVMFAVEVNRDPSTPAPDVNTVFVLNHASYTTVRP